MWSDLQQRAHWGLSFEAVKTWLPNEKERDTSVQRETVFIPVYLRREAALVKQLYRHRFSFSLDVQLNLLFFFLSFFQPFCLLCFPFPPPPFSDSLTVALEKEKKETFYDR